MTKPTKWVCAQRGLRSAWASDQHGETLGPLLPIERTAHSEDSGGCPGWSESSLRVHSFCWFCHVVAHIRLMKTGLANNGGLIPWNLYCLSWSIVSDKKRAGSIVSDKKALLHIVKITWLWQSVFLGQTSLELFAVRKRRLNGRLMLQMKRRLTSLCPESLY